jgi:hypothetical protein
MHVWESTNPSYHCHQLLLGALLLVLAHHPAHQLALWKEMTTGEYQNHQIQ